MDPQTAFNDMITAFRSSDWETCEDRSTELLRWLNRGGFSPSPFHADDVKGLCRVFNRIACSEIERVQKMED